MSRTLRVWIIDALVAVWFKIGFPQETIVDDNVEEGFVWIEPIPEEFVMGEIKIMADTNNVKPERIYGYWHGQKGASGKLGLCATPGEKVLYYFHGKCSLSEFSTKCYAYDAC